MKYTDLEKHAIASLIIRICSEENKINIENKMHLFDILKFIGMSESELMSLRGANELQESVTTIVKMPKEKRLDLLVIILRLAMNFGNEKKASFFLIIKQGIFNDITDEELNRIDVCLDSILTVINFAYWKTVENK